ncbi:hypothetical protein SERLA73DRAFT_115150 [Serpula lacrymans var. lacrymans S7.3]|uniref:Anaphase-promoting complex subunit 4 WD40 domain-containing protein n=2 Tax=Serpula lacrymans var. lacrymans TaxID=341189 RepID=F8QC76_SERL3|nr:uncharacterized protein SERLADRAFT_418407 [Serpula lacrymans var. lacrymans S7.9]EGN94195.1 hypothetical protein SERLA73DRAFT_115150 [Serpula lacrymans var. lacrymans S7.3]EGO19619.1 hypothetical protein SERLADRAFT_418407 [Serpula lacrymans var. lacrymans S7.9]
MAKNARKRQRTEKNQDEQAQPLGAKVALDDDASKDDEERRLESILFGVPYKPSGNKGKDVLAFSDEEEDLEDVGAGKELENMLDSDLFFVDDSTMPSGGIPDSQTSQQEDEDREQDDEADDAEVSDAGLTEVQPQDFSEGQLAPSENPLSSKGRKAPAWMDPDDANIQISLASNNRLRKMRDAPSDDTVGGREYERRLRRQYERINPTPDWASNARQKLHKSKRRRSSVSGSESEDGDEFEDFIPDILNSTAGIVGTRKSRKLPQGTLSIERLRDANQAAPAEGEIKALHFHPSPQVPMLLTASSDRRLRLFHIDGLTNPHMQTLHIPSLPLSNAVFHPDGSSILLTGSRPFYYTYDLQSGASHRSPRGLWGTTFSSDRTAQGATMEMCAFNPTGDILAVAGRRGYIHLVDWRSGTAQVTGELKANTAIKSIWWARGGRGELMSLGEDSQVYVWDIGQRRCVKRWQDEGGFGSRLMSGDKAGNYLAIGSTGGLVNVYGSHGTSQPGDERSKPLKTIGNITTSISTLRFNHDSQLLAVASNVKKDQLRLIHLPSLTAFGNWPTSSTPLGHVTAIDFSSTSQYLAVGNNRGRALLYSLRDFTQL